MLSRILLTALASALALPFPDLAVSSPPFKRERCCRLINEQALAAGGCSRISRSWFKRMASLPLRAGSVARREVDHRDTKDSPPTSTF